MTITLEEYRRLDAAGLIRRPLTWGQTLRMHQGDNGNVAGTADILQRSSPLESKG